MNEDVVRLDRFHARYRIVSWVLSAGLFALMGWPSRGVDDSRAWLAIVVVVWMVGVAGMLLVAIAALVAGFSRGGPRWGLLFDWIAPPLAMAGIAILLARVTTPHL